MRKICFSCCVFERAPSLVASASGKDRLARRCFAALALAIGLGGSLHGNTRSSAAYEVTIETLGAGGGSSAAGGYAQQGGFGVFSPATSHTAETLTMRSGFVGQLYEVVSLQVAAPAGAVRTGSQLTLTATQLLDDGTALVLDPNRVAWSVTSGPVAAISSAGLATAGAVAVDTAAIVRADYGAWSDDLALTVLAKLTQSIAFAPPAEILFQLTPLGLSATATSGLAVGFAVVAGPATLDGASLNLSDVGLVTVRATQDGNVDYATATPLERTVLIRASYDHWRAENFSPTTWTQEAISGPGAAPTADGWPNLVKYALGVSVADAGESPLPLLAADAAEWIYVYLRPADRSDVAYAVEASTDLTTWTSAGVAHEFVSNSSGTETWRARYPRVSAPRLFFRLKITR